MLVDPGGVVAHSAAVPTPFRISGSGCEMTCEAFIEALTALLQSLGAPRSEVVAAGVAGMAEVGAPFDREGAPLAPIIAWHDRRGQEVAAGLLEEFPELPLQIGQRLRYVSSAAKLGWLVERGCRDFSRWLGVPEIVLKLLTGAEATEHSLASRTGWFDIHRQKYLPEVVRAVGVRIEALPPVKRAGTPMGEINKKAGSWSGLPRGAKVTLAGHDHLAGAAGAGASGGDMVNSVGTAETVVRSLPESPDISHALRLRIAVSVAPGGDRYCMFTGAARAGLVASRVAEYLGADPGTLDRLAEQAEPLPIDDEEIRSIQADGPVELRRDRPGGVWRGLLEALTRRTREAVVRLSELTGPATRLLVIGGGQSRPWLEAKAAAVRMPVFHADTPYAAARGAALYAGTAAGWWASPEDAPHLPLQQVPFRSRDL